MGRAQFFDDDFEATSNLKQIIENQYRNSRVGNSGVEPTVMIETQGGTVMSEASELPFWARDSLEVLRLWTPACDRTSRD